LIYRALLVFVALLLVALLLPDLKHSAGNVVIPKTFSFLCGAGLMAVLRLLWGVWQVRRPWHKLLLAGLAGIMVILVTLSLPSFVTVRVSSSRNACMAQLRDIQGAKEIWAREHKKSPTDVPQPSDLIGSDKYLLAIPVCPLGGTYRLGAVREKATCSNSSPGHTLDSSRRATIGSSADRITFFVPFVRKFRGTR
jgi:hypothetical protein